MDANTIKIAETAIREQEKQIRFEVKPFRVEDLIKKFEKGQFYIPDYQREDVWTYPMKSKFIESILLGLPIPDIYVCATRENDDDYDQLTKYEVIDGSQRMRTLVSFAKDEFRLNKMENIKELNKFEYKDLTAHRKDKFNDVTIDVIILQADTSEEVKTAMFDRINTSNPLKAMELRRGSYAGLFRNFIIECGEILQSKKYRGICPISKHFRDRKEEEELALRFFAFAETYKDNLSFVDVKGNKISKYNKSTDDFLTLFYDYQNMRLKKIEQANKLEYQEEMNRLRESFTKVLDFVKKYFPRGFRREKSKNSVARVVFEAISVGVYLALEKEPSLLNKEKVDTNWIRSKDFKDSVDQKYALHDAKRIMERINVVKDKLLNQ